MKRREAVLAAFAKRGFYNRVKSQNLKFGAPHGCLLGLYKEFVDKSTLAWK